MVNLHKGKCAYKKFYCNIPDDKKYLNTFGEMGVVWNIISIKFKIKYQKMKCMLLGYVHIQMGSICCMLNIHRKITVV